MKSETAINAFAALAHETRLAAFRQLVQAGGEGVQASALADHLGVARPVMSFHLAQLEAAGLVSVEKAGRARIYRAAFGAMRALIDFMTEDCCAGFAGRAQSADEEDAA